MSKALIHGEQGFVLKFFWCILSVFDVQSHHSIVLVSQILIRSRIIFDRVRFKPRKFNLAPHYSFYVVDSRWNLLESSKIQWILRLMDSSFNAADFQHQRIFFSQVSTQDQLYFNRDQLKKGLFGLFKSLFVVSLCTPPQALQVGSGWALSESERLKVTRTEI